MNINKMPALSVIVPTPDHYDTVRKTLQALRAQTVRDLLEIVIVGPSSVASEIDESELGDFLQFRVVEVDQFTSSGRSRAEGVHCASAPLVAFAEDHAYPDPEWAAYLIKAHRDDWAAVVPGVFNGTPESMVGWSAHMIAYGSWDGALPSGEIETLPTHNTVYKRRLLVKYGADLGEMLDFEKHIHRDLRENGYQFYLETSARIYHCQFTKLLPSLQLLYHGGRIFAASRLRYWSTLRRLLYIVGLPLVAADHLRRVLKATRRSGRQHGIFPKILPALVMGWGVFTFGEMTGYMGCAGSSVRRFSQLEFHRE